MFENDYKIDIHDNRSKPDQRHNSWLFIKLRLESIRDLLYIRKTSKTSF